MTAARMMSKAGVRQGGKVVARVGRRGLSAGTTSTQLADEIWRLRADNPTAYLAARAMLRVLVDKKST